MRKITDNDIPNIIGTTVNGYHVEAVRIKQGELPDSDNYGYILGKNANGHYVTWQFHLDENDKPHVYWGRYFTGKIKDSINDYNSRDLPCVPELSSDYWDCECSDKYIQSNSVEVCPICKANRDEQPDSHQSEVDEGIHFADVSGSLRLYKVTITETLQKIVTTTSNGREEAEQIVSDEWNNGKYILTSEDFTGMVEFNAIPVDE